MAVASARTVAGRPELKEGLPDGPARGKPAKFNEAAEWTGGFEEGKDEIVRFRCPGGVCESDDGTIYVSDAYNHVIRKRAPDAAWCTLAGKPGEKGVVDGEGDEARFSYPQRIALDESGNILVAGGGSHVLHRVTPAGQVCTIAGVGGNGGHADGQGTEALLNRPIGLAINHSNGDIYLGEVGAHCIRKVSKRGHVTTLAGKSKEKGFADGVGAEVRFNQPCGIAFFHDDAEGHLIIADFNNHCIRKLSLKDNSVVTMVGKGEESGCVDGVGEEVRFKNPSDVAVDSAGTTLVVCLSICLFCLCSIFHSVCL